MLLGFGAFGELPISTSGADNSVTIAVTKSSLVLNIGNPGITADSIVEIPTPSQVTLGNGTVVITADGNVSPTKSSLVLGTGNVTVSAGATVSPTKSGFTISSGTVTITGGAVVDPTKSTFTLASGTAQAIVWSEIIPGVSATWIPIDPGI